MLTREMTFKFEREESRGGDGGSEGTGGVNFQNVEWSKGSFQKTQEDKT